MRNEAVLGAGRIWMSGSSQECVFRDEGRRVWDSIPSKSRHLNAIPMQEAPFAETIPPSIMRILRPVDLEKG